MNDYLEIPWQKLSPDALEGMLEELVSREGTDYGEQECGHQQKMAQLRQALQENRAIIAFCPQTESWTVLPKHA